MATIKEFQHLTIPLTAVMSATDNFSESNRVGKGGFGPVYRGQLLHSDRHSIVAVKRLDRHFGQGDPEFWKEIMMLSLYKHENIVSLLGFCNENRENIIVYEYATNRSLDLYLNRSDLTWIQRLRICIGAARGLEYLHDPKGTQQRILHRDIKSSNILLDENWKAKISDFGLSKMGPANQQFTFLVSNTVGTFGYCDPLYMETGFLTKESDVYSFGVVLFEVLCGRLCIGNHNSEPRSFTRLVRKCFKQNKMNEIIYEAVKEQINPNALKVFVEIAYKCLKTERDERPTMTQIVKELENALEAQIVAVCDVGKMLHGCKHYRRRCKLRAPCCDQIFPCRHCHNEHTSALDDPNERHKMVLKDVKQVVCTICNTEQPFAQICGNCGVKMGEYFCGICHLYDDDTSKRQFHCDDCGICRLYGRENYFHCHKCGGCYSGSHTCLENAMKRDCGVCHECLFDSVKNITVMSCGHTLHTDCYLEIISSKRCPICSKATDD